MTDEEKVKALEDSHDFELAMPYPLHKKIDWEIQFGVAVFKTNAMGIPGKKIKEIKFQNEKDMAYWLYKNDKEGRE